MGYRSDILIAVAFKTKTQFDEVWAVYCMDPMVQKHNLAEQWTRSDEDEHTPVIFYYEEGIKWYENYDDVKGIERMLTLVEEFYENRKLPFAWLKYRVGEDLKDTEVEEYCSDSDGTDLLGELWKRANIERRIEHSF